MKCLIDSYDYVEENHYSLKITTLLPEKTSLTIDVRSKDSKSINYITQDLEPFGSHTLHFYDKDFSNEMVEGGMRVTETFIVNIKAHGTDEVLNKIIEPSLLYKDGSIQIGFL